MTKLISLASIIDLEDFLFIRFFFYSDDYLLQEYSNFGFFYMQLCYYK